jgi:hypothetical protein
MWLLAAGILALALTAVGIADAVVRGLRLWRATKRLGNEATATLERTSAASAQIQVQLERAQASQERLQRAVDDLTRSRARLQVQLDALTSARAEVRRVLWFMPGV